MGENVNNVENVKTLCKTTRSDTERETIKKQQQQQKHLILQKENRANKNGKMKRPCGIFD